MRHKLLLLFFILSFFTGSIFLHGCQPVSEKTSVSGYKLNTIVSIDAYSKTTQDTLYQCLNLCDKYELMFSRTLEDSLLYKVNHQQLTEIPAELAELIQYGIDYSRISDGAFDLTIGSVSQLWDFTAETPTVPNQADIDKALTHVDYRNVVLNQKSEDIWTISIPEGTVIDLGAIAKGYIADCLKDYLLENGVTRAVINLGGNVLCVGQKASRADFSIGVKKPFSDSGEFLVILSLNDWSAVSSGTYERYFYDSDNFYHHILNPSTGFPYNNGLTDVTILSKESVIGDCLSTACFTLGLDKGMKIVESLDGIEAIFVTEDGTIHYSSGVSSYIKK